MGVERRTVGIQGGMWKDEEGPITVWLVGEGKINGGLGEKRMAKAQVLYYCG